MAFYQGSILRIFQRFGSGYQGICRLMSDVAANPEELKLKKLLQTRFPQATAIEVQDISGGCGAMYEVWVESIDFKGLNRVKQHKLITQTLKKEIKDMHGLRITTSVPEET
ncbi:bolA-like protein 3 [Macrobrachium rosenbergii]|uniref:bolA-like protein 3 n=1 Tax=Macrobrachium rosenbergii TaxID=79674 RepID=UPI0034D5E369